MITPNDILITKEEFETLVNNAEKEFLKERNKQSINEKEDIVQFWINITETIVPKSYLDELEQNYRNVGWKRVRIEFINDRTKKLMIYLSME